MWKGSLKTKVYAISQDPEEIKRVVQTLKEMEAYAQTQQNNL